MKKTIIGLLMSAGLASSAFAEKGPNELITYATITAPQYIDVGPKGPSIGDQYMRHGGVSLTPEGAPVGTYDTQAMIVFFDEASKRVTRSFASELVLPEGTLYKKDFMQSEHGKPLTAGHQHEGAIIGGTGKYAGVRGTYTIEIMPAGKLAKTTHNFWLGQ
jgi:hypothetical protein